MPNRRRSRQAKAVVTGAGSGIGRAFALEIAARGGQVVCADIRLDQAQETVALIGRLNGAHALACDVSRLEDVEQLASEAERLLGAPADLLVNNAGVGIGGKPVGEIGIEDWRWALGVNLWGVIHGCHVFAPRLRALGHGGIINVASAASFAAAPLMGPYNVSKAGALALSETLAAELAGSGVAVTALCPTFVKTNIVRDGRIAEGSSRFASKLMRWSGVSPESVVRKTLDALDRGEPYVLPQLDARLVWRGKRLAPVTYQRGAALLGRLMKRA